MSGLWFEVTAVVPPDDVEAVSEIMRDISPGGITVEEPFDALGPELGFRIRKGEPVHVKAYLPSSELGAILTQRLRDALDDFPHVEVIAKPFYEQDWAVAWREFFGPVTVDRVTIVPSWIEELPAEADVIIRLDPGQAFGTGHHETTRLCLGALQQAVTPGCRMLDVGVGSGVLAIAAVKLGAAQVDGLDIDTIAIEVAGTNCAENGVAEQVSLAHGTLTVDRGEVYDLVVANISRQANVELAPAFANAVRAGGELLLSGILERDAGIVVAAMAEQGFEETGHTTEADWCQLAFRRP